MPDGTVTKFAELTAVNRAAKFLVNEKHARPLNFSMPIEVASFPDPPIPTQPFSFNSPLSFQYSVHNDLRYSGFSLTP